VVLGRRVLEGIVARAEPTILLTMYAIIVAVVLGVPAGVLAARYHDRTTDQALMAGALIGISIPNFLLGLLLILFFSVRLGWFPLAGYSPLEYCLAAPPPPPPLPAFPPGRPASPLLR